MKTIITLFTLLLAFSNAIGQANEPGSGHSLMFDGIDDHGEATIPAVVTIPYTVEYWVKMDAPTTYVNMVISYQDDTADFTQPYYGFWTGLRQTGLPMMSYGDGTGPGPTDRRTAIAQNPIAMGTWTHIAWVVKGPNDFELYVNGVQNSVNYSGSGNATMGQHPNGYHTSIGKSARWSIYNINNYYFATLEIDELKLWNDARSKTEIRENMCKKLIGNEPGLVGYWRFDEGAGNTAFDSSSNTNDATLY